MSRLVVIGGSDAGTEAALAAKRADPSLEVTVLVADGYLNYSICGLPFLVSGEVPDWRALAHRTQEDVAAQGIEILLEHRAQALDVDRRRIEVAGPDATTVISYDRLVIATGAIPVRPTVGGLDDPDVHLLHTMSDGIGLRDRLDRDGPRDAIVIGTGYIGVEMADALTHRGIHVTLVGRSPSVLPAIDRSLGDVLRAELERNGVTVITGATVDGIARVGRRLEARIAPSRTVSGELVVIGAGVRPDAELAHSAGLSLGPGGAIQVTRGMQTSAPAVFAAGDCVETWHATLQRPTYVPLGTTAHKQGRVAGQNAAGREAMFRGSMGTQVVKVFDLAAGRTGLSAREAEAAGLSPTEVQTIVPDHKPYYPGAHDLQIRIIGDISSGKLLGAQIVGHWQAEVAKRLDVLVTALHEGLAVQDLLDLDLSYTPPLGSPWDPIQKAADAWLVDSPPRPDANRPGATRSRQRH